jgi:glutamine cyclotransferase
MAWGQTMIITGGMHLHSRICRLQRCTVQVLFLIFLCLTAYGNEVSSDPGSFPEASLKPQASARAEPVEYTYRVVHTYPHDRRAYTQGLIYHKGRLYEGTGLHGRSSLREVELETGKILRIHNLPERYFGEGIALFDARIVQLTWESRLGFVYEQDSFNQIREFRYTTEGWGITHDGQRWIMSDGSETLFFRDSQTLMETGRVQVFDRGRPVGNLNELEYVKGKILANVWTTDRIAQIDSDTGTVTGWVDLSGLSARMDLSQQIDVLNGIAYDPDNDRLFVTGKLWPNLFEIVLIPAHP